LLGAFAFSPPTRLTGQCGVQRR